MMLAGLSQKCKIPMRGARPRGFVSPYPKGLAADGNSQRKTKVLTTDCRYCILGEGRMMMKYRVRFHLQRGEHYLHWQVRADDGSVQYLDPSKYQIEMLGCKLVNKKNAARKVYDAGVKDVCGWVECDNYFARFVDDLPIDNLERLRYNPIVDPCWRREDDDGDFDWDNYHFDSLVTDGNKVYVLEERCYA